MPSPEGPNQGPTLEELKNRLKFAEGVKNHFEKWGSPEETMDRLTCDIAKIIRQIALLTKR